MDDIQFDRQALLDFCNFALASVQELSDQCEEAERAIPYIDAVMNRITECNIPQQKQFLKAVGDLGRTARVICLEKGFMNGGEKNGK